MSLVLACSACGNEATFFPPGLEPLEPMNLAKRPAALTETFGWAEGEAREWEWVHARTFIRAPIAQVWTAFQDADVVSDRRQVDEYSVLHDVEMGFDTSFVVHNIVHDFVTVEFDMTWRQSAVEGDQLEPEVVGVRFQKTFGTVFIDILRGSVVLRRAAEDDQVTELEMIEHIAAAQGGPETLKSYLTDLHTSVIARVHGAALPVYPD